MPARYKISFTSLRKNFNGLEAAWRSEIHMVRAGQISATYAQLRPWGRGSGEMRSFLAGPIWVGGLKCVDFVTTLLFLFTLEK